MQNFTFKSDEVSQFVRIIEVGEVLKTKVGQILIKYTYVIEIEIAKQREAIWYCNHKRDVHNFGLLKSINYDMAINIIVVFLVPNQRKIFLNT